MKRLNEMKVAVALLDAAAASGSVLDAVWPGYVSDIAGHLADAPHLFRDDPVRRIAQVIIDAANMDDLYDDEDEALSVGPRETTWTDAQADEVWELEFDDGAIRAYIFDGFAFVGELRPGGGNSIPAQHPSIVAGRRVWMPR
jgi:hypothetical protein